MEVERDKHKRERGKEREMPVVVFISIVQEEKRVERVSLPNENSNAHCSVVSDSLSG